MPFIHYDIHRQLTYKLRMYGLNAVFGLKIQISVGDGLMTAIATGTAVYARPLPTPPALKVFRNLDILDEEDERLMDIQKKLMEISEANRTKIEHELQILKENEAKIVAPSTGSKSQGMDDDSEGSVTSDSDSDAGAFSSTIQRPNAKPGAIIQIDDEADEDLVLFMDEPSREDFDLFNTEIPRGSALESISTDMGQISSQMVMIIKQKAIPPGHHPNRQFSEIFKSMYHDLSFQLHHWRPCVVSKISHSVQVTKDEHVQVAFTAMVQGIEMVSLELNPYGSFRSLVEPAADVFDDAQEDKLDVQSATESDNQDELVHELEEGEEEKEEKEEYLLGTSQTGNSQMDAASYSDRSYMKGDISNLLREMDRASFRSPVREQLSARDPRPSTKQNSALRTEARASQTSLGGGTMARQTSISNVAVGQVELSPLSHVPSNQTECFLGRISLHFIKETHLAYESHSGMNGMGGFTVLFLQEMMAIVKSHVTGLGGNAIVGYNLDQTIFTETNNQGYALVSISGDIVKVSLTATSQ